MRATSRLQVIMHSFKQRLGCWLHERWKAELVLRAATSSARTLTWLDLCNRHEHLAVDVKTGGRECLWQDSSPLTVPKVFPRVGGRLLAHCLRQWPISFSDPTKLAQMSQPSISFVLGVRGTKRLPQFQACLASLCSQTSVSAEIIVVEQSHHEEFASLIPRGVRYYHLETENADVPYNRSWALNYGVRQARGDLVVILDADMLLPERFGAAMLDVFTCDIDAVRPIRLLFYLDQSSSAAVQEQKTLANLRAVSSVVQNTPNPIVIRRDAYLEIGGHDESFYGWGGEDNEFISRLRTRQMAEGGFLPAVHLWHEEAPNRTGDRNAAQLQERLAIRPEERIRQFAAQPFGQAEPTVPWLATPAATSK